MRPSFVVTTEHASTSDCNVTIMSTALTALMNRTALQVRVFHGLGRPTGWVGLGWVESRFLAFWWVGLGRRSETFPEILKFVTAEVIPDNLIMINTDK